MPICRVFFYLKGGYNLQKMIKLGINQFLLSFVQNSPPLPHQEDYKYLLSEDEKQNLVLIGSVPWGGIAQVRIHWLLDLVTIE